MFGWLDRLLTWDERHDGTQPSLRPQERLPPKNLTIDERRFLDAIADGMWIHEDSLREKLRWSRWQFFKVTMRMVNVDWILARPAGTSLFSKSEYRLNPEAWNNG